MLPDNIFLAFAMIFFLRVCDVSMGTIRTIYTLHGRKLLATGIGFIEVTIFIYAITQVMKNLNDPILMIAYSGGFAAGTYVGLLLEEKFAIGYAQLRIISRDKGEQIARCLWARDFGATVLRGHGKEGEVDLLFSIVPRKNLRECVSIASGVDDQSFVAIADSRYVYRGHIGQHGKRK
jgi:uncharacterized protein YebE (UPF0316 family)